jgi:hypothetical protein
MAYIGISSFNWTADLGVQRSEIWQNEDPSFSLDVDKMPMKDPPKQRSLRGNIYRFPMVSHGFPGFSQEINIVLYIVFLYVFRDILPSSQKSRRTTKMTKRQCPNAACTPKTAWPHAPGGRLHWQSPPMKISIHRNAWWEFHKMSRVHTQKIPRSLGSLGSL